MFNHLILENNTWTLVAMYGCMFEGRAGHSLVQVQDDTLMIFGGMD